LTRYGRRTEAAKKRPGLEYLWYEGGIGKPTLQGEGKSGKKKKNRDIALRRKTEKGGVPRTSSPEGGSMIAFRTAMEKRRVGELIS